jgi:uncharacterized protein YjbI with pentapeptide repeats
MLTVPPVAKQHVHTQQELNALLLAHERYARGRGGTRAQLAHANLDGLDFANRQLAEADFAGTSLVNTTFYGANLERASLYCADLRGANLRFATLIRTDIRGASLKGASLAHAVLDGADLRAAKILMYREGEGFSVLDRNTSDSGLSVGGSDKAHGVDFSNCSLKNVSFAKALLDGTNFSGALLQGARFKGAKVTNPCFHGAVLTGVHLGDLDLPADALEGAVLDVTPEAAAKAEMLKAALARHQDWIASGGKKGTQAKFAGLDLRPLAGSLSNRVLSALEIPNCIAIGVDFSASHLQAAKFDGADLRDANFSGADLRGVSFRGAKLTHARFDQVNLGDLAMADGRAVRPDFTGAQASLDQFSAATLDAPLSKLGLETTD